MKQRLGLAWALLANPQLLILDEPTNGLDPHGIKEIRELLFFLNKEKGVTVLVSSHILSELEKLVTDVGIISKGELVFQGAITELLEYSVNKLVIDTDDAERLINMLIKSDYTPEREGESSVKIKVKNKDEVIALTREFVKNEVPFYGLRNEQKSFEDIFFDLMKN
jgi:ABC-2 type transport system ATP-binding protein